MINNARDADKNVLLEIMDAKIHLEELFSGHSLHFDAMQPEVAARIASHLGLVYIDHTAEKEANVCQANAADVRPEYRTAVSAREVFHYLVAALQDQPEKSVPLPYPSDLQCFWTLVQRGRELDLEGV